MYSRFALALVVTAVFALSACTGQQRASSTSSKAGGPKIELAGTSPSPCPAGRCLVSILLKNEQGQPIESADVRYEARHTSMGHGGVSSKAEYRDNGRYEGTLSFSMSGDWSVGVNVRLPGNNTVFAETINLGVK